MEANEDRTVQGEQSGEGGSSERGAELEARVAQELKKHNEPEYSWDKWYCQCGFRLRSGYAELATHQGDVEQKLRAELNRG